MSAGRERNRYLLTGANRGLGLGLTRLWLEAGHEVIALAREPESSEGLRELASRHGERLLWRACDVADDSSVEAAREAVAAHCGALDLLLNNAGVYGPKGDSLDSLDFEQVRRVFEVNTLGALRVTRAFRPLLARGRRPRALLMSSLMGSIADNGSGSSWAYRMSKAALNMAGRNLAHELSAEGIVTAVLHPGWVRTDMGGAGAPLGVEEAVAEMAATMERLGPEQDGCFLDRQGAPLPW
jgi:NAD(P)-dependent dehydrogenase (short-subunit alcohol dehydrogenase family)